MKEIKSWFIFPKLYAGVFNTSKSVRMMPYKNIIKDKEPILYGVLNWGIGHASRSIPVIRILMKYDYEVHIASSGRAMELLNIEFPDAQFVRLPDYGVTYPTRFMVVNFFLFFFSMFKAKFREQQKVAKYCRKNNIRLVFSDNRFGVFLKEGYNIFLTHQLRIPGKTILEEYFATCVHSHMMKSFQEIWIPDFPPKYSIAGHLSHIPSRQNKQKKYVYIGGVTRFPKMDHTIEEKDIDWLIVLSGPEPARSKLEKKLITLLSPTTLSIVLVKGKVEKDTIIRRKFVSKGMLDMYDITALCKRAKNFCSRSGYSSILDLSRIQLPCLLIPTPGQQEQEFLAKYLHEKFAISTVNQSEIKESDFFSVHSKLEIENDYEKMLHSEISRVTALKILHK